VNFTITARVVSQLGAELISSDEVAIYELVKNGFDAGSSVVEVNINHRLDISIVKRIQEIVLNGSPDTILEHPVSPETRRSAIAALSSAAVSDNGQDKCLLLEKQFDELKTGLTAATSVRDFLKILGRVNSIDIVDYGGGMTGDEVTRYYLTIGTTHRLHQLRHIDHGNPESHVPSGEKGIGRLSAMRLGYELEMFTVPAKGEQSVLVAIHWRDFEMLVDRDLTEVPVEVDLKEKGNTAPGTLITISDLHSNWSRHRAIKLASEHLTKFLDPFPALRLGQEAAQRNSIETQSGTQRRRTLVLRWNGELVDATAALKQYLDNCTNSFLCELRVPQNGTPELVSEFNFAASGSHANVNNVRSYSVVDFADITEPQLRSVGPFEFALYHFPRNKLKAIPQWATRAEFKSWLDGWCGGLMVFRDGVRVLPYATPGDDWLDLDSRALRGQGFRVNRIQVVGFVRISRMRNAGLIDQTNREGLRDNEAFQTFKELIQRHIHRNFVPALNEHLSEAKPDWAYLSLRVQEQQDALAKSVETVLDALKREDWKAVKDSAKDLAQFSDQLREFSAVVETALTEKEASKLEILELAATGMAAESMAHDLEGAVESAVATLGELARLSPEKSVVASISHLRAVHKSLLTQIKQLSPGPARSRRRSSTFDLVEIAGEAAQVYRERCNRHHIEVQLPPKGVALTVQAVNGHVRQILDNLFRNSIFWLQDTKKKFPEDAEHWIRIEADPIARQLRFSDSGVGIAKEDAEWVFRPFTSRRSEGRGLGLYICKELADFNGVNLRLDTTDTNRRNRLKTFVMEFPEKQ
jgi:signal transduction histidine kinase